MLCVCIICFSQLKLKKEKKKYIFFINSSSEKKKKKKAYVAIIANKTPKKYACKYIYIHIILSLSL